MIRVEAEKRDDGKWYTEDKSNSIDMGDVYAIIAVIFIFWPPLLFVLCVSGMVLLVWKSAMKLMLTALQGIAKKLPEISVKKAKSDSTI